MIRVFLGIELSACIREKLFCLQQQLKKTLPSINWVRQESLHLTLKFLGDVEPSIISQLRSALEPLGAKRGGFSLAVQGVGVFPQGEHPRVLWVRLTGDVHVLQELVLEAEAALEPLGFPPQEKVFHPHLTLARIKRENAAVGAALLESGVLDSDQNLGTLPIERFTLFRSDLDSSGAMYTALWTIPFFEEAQGS